MPIAVCETCGSELLPAMRFCRKCGHPTGNATSAETQGLGSIPAVGAPTTVLNSNVTAPAYLSPGSQSPPALSSAARESVSAKRSRRPIVIAVLIVVLGAVVICVFIFRKAHTDETQQTAGSGSSGSYSTVAIDQRFIYPGSKPGLSISRQNRTVAQFQTTDPIGKVIEWYKYKMKVSEVKITPGGQQAVLTLDKSTVTITSGGNVTNITVTQER